MAQIPFDFDASKTHYLELVNKTPHKKLDRSYFDKILCEMIKDAPRVREGLKPRGSLQYRQNYELYEEGCEVCLIKKRDTHTEPVMKYVPLEDSFNILIKAHLTHDHAAPDRMRQILSKEYIMKGIYYDLCVLACNTCSGKRVVSSKNVENSNKQNENVTAKRKISKHEKNISKKKSNQEDRTVHLHLIDMDLIPDGNFKLLLAYKFRRTSFVLLRPLIARCAFEVATELLKIFTSFGPPETLIVPAKEKRFYANTLENLKLLGITCRIPLKTRTKHNRFTYISKVIRDWMVTTGSSNWGLGCHAVQLTINNNPSFVDSNNYKYPYYDDGIATLATPHLSLFHNHWKKKSKRKTITQSTSVTPKQQTNQEGLNLVEANTVTQTTIESGGANDSQEINEDIILIEDD